MYSQQPAIKGRLVDAITDVPLPQVRIAIEGFFYETYSGADGEFSVGGNLSAKKEVVLFISKTGYITKRFPVKIGPESKSVGDIMLQPDAFAEQSQHSTISLSDAELLAEEGKFDNISGILQSTRDVYLNAAAFDFGQTFFRVRGVGSEYGKLLINGIEMNKLYDGRPQWSNWGGLNDVQRNQVFSIGIGSNEYNFGGLGGTTNILMRASKYQPGSRISISGSNRSYSGRLLATHVSGEKGKGWFYAVSTGKRYAREGYIDGTQFDSYSFFASVEKKINDGHEINFSAIYTPLIRGKSAPITQEVIDLKGGKYNPYWGFQEEEIRNSRIREVSEPVFMINHFWKLSERLRLNTNLSYQFGEVSNSRIDYGGTNVVNLDDQQSYLGGGSNPDPVYYQKLPSYYLRFQDQLNFEAAYRAQNDLTQGGQLDWQQLYSANIINNGNGNNAVYALAEDVNRDQQLSANLILNWNVENNFKVIASAGLKDLQSENFARLKDLLGGRAFLDIDVFAEEVSGSPLTLAMQSNLNDPQRLVNSGDTYKYNYDIQASEIEGFLQAQYFFRKLEISLSGNIGEIRHQRNGYYKNGIYPGNSFGVSDLVTFFEYGLKTGFTYKFSGRQNVEYNMGYFLKAPGFKNVFINPRQNNQIVENPEEEIIQASDISYRYRSSKFNLRLTGYYTRINNATEVSYYFTNGLGGLGRRNTAAFVQEALTDIEKQHIGLELGTEYQITPTLKIKSALALGQFTYANNPRLSLSSASFENSVSYGKANLKDYRLAGGPQQAALLGFEYRDPGYWWFGATVNHFAHAYIDIHALSRTSNFQMDYDGFPLLDYEPQVAEKLLKQERFDDYFLVNMVGGKSWRIRDKYLGIFVSVNNLLDQQYKSGGFEQARNSNYRTLKQDRDRDLPVFGNKYWLGIGTSFFTNVSFRF